MNVPIRFKDRENPVRYVLGRDLVPHPLNWRLHPEAQQNAVRGVLAEIGLADVLKVVELPDGRYQLADGHLRAEILPDQEIPVLVLDLTPEETKKLLLTYDPVAAMAEVDHAIQQALMDQVAFESAAVNAMLADIAGTNAIGAGGDGSDGETPRAGGEAVVAEKWGVLVNLPTEAEQVRLIELLQQNGFSDFRTLVA